MSAGVSAEVRAHTGPDRLGSRPDETSAHCWARWSLLAGPAAIYLAWAWSRRWMSDDGLIYLRVVRQLLAGHGPVFNGGERVEVTTGPMWTAILVVGDVLTPVRLEWIAVGLGMALGAAGLLLAIFGSRRLLGVERTEITVPVGAAVLVALPPMWTFASSGLETGLSFAWLGACCFVLAGWARRGDRLPPWDAVLLGLGPLIRPDLGLFTIAFLAVVVIGGRSWRDRLAPLGWALALPAAYQLFRMGYYGSLVPNSAIAKEASRSRWDFGWDYLRAAFDPYWLWIPLVVLAIGAYLPLGCALRVDRKTRALLVVGGFAIAAIVYGIYIVRVGGDFMHARLILPGVFAFAAPVAVVPLRRRFAASLLLAPWVVVSMFVLRSTADQYVDFATGTKNPVTIDDFPGWEEGGGFRSIYEDGGLFYSDRRLPAESASGRRTEIASFGIGVVGYALGPDVYILDLLGLGDAFTSHLELERRGIPAHEKPLPAPWIVARLVAPGDDLDAGDFPFPAALGGTKIPQLEDARQISFDDRVRFARMALRCKDLRDFQRTYSGSLTMGRFFGNIVDSFHDTDFRIPPEPRDAYRRFCSP